MSLLVISVLICALMLGLFLFCYFRSKGKYDEYLEYIDKKEYSLKDFIPIGLEYNEMDFFHRVLPKAIRLAAAKHSNNIYRQLLELHGPKDVDFYAYIHNGYRSAMGIISAVGASIFGALMVSQGNGDGIYLSIAAPVLLFAMPFVADESLKSEIEKRRLKISMEFPEFVNKLTLLVNAGMTISKAWAKIVNDNKRNHVLYDEMRLTLGEIQAGKPEAVAYEEFARRCHIKEVTKFVSVIVMNLRRGGAEVVPVLKLQGEECWEMRKNAARAMGEQASTKILIPMMMMFMGIVLVVATPAVLSMTSGM